MLFWFIILFVSVALVIGVAIPLVSMARQSEHSNLGGELKGNRLAATALLAVAPVAAVAIYLEIGNPLSIDPAYREQQARQREEPTALPIPAFDDIPADQRLEFIEEMVEGLATRLETSPDDFEGLRMLARSYGILGRKAESIDAYRDLTLRDPEAGMEDWSNFATALFVGKAPGADYSDEFLHVLAKLQAYNKDDPLSLFYLGFVAREEGDRRAALEYWRRLLSVLPADAPVRAQLTALIEEGESALPE